MNSQPSVNSHCDRVKNSGCNTDLPSRAAPSTARETALTPSRTAPPSPHPQDHCRATLTQNDTAPQTA